MEYTRYYLLVFNSLLKFYVEFENNLVFQTSGISVRYFELNMSTYFYYQYIEKNFASAFGKPMCEQINIIQEMTAPIKRAERII